MNFIDNYFKLNTPLTKEVFFKQSIILIILQSILALFMASAMFIYKKPWEFIIIFFIIIIFEIPLLTSYFIMTTRRLWNITGKRQQALLINIPMFVISFTPPIFLIIFYIYFILKSGAYVAEQD